MKFLKSYIIPDLFEKLIQKRKYTTPGRTLRLLVGPFDNPKLYEKDAKEFINNLETYVKIKKDFKILDVGCGSGRLIFELYSRYRQCKFYGFDIIPKLINWDKKISKNLGGNFDFKLINVFNELYNPKGSIRAEKIHFPYDNNVFDLIIVQSVFTHMLSESVNRYLDEIYRVLKPGGKAVVTFFVISKDSINGILRNKSKFSFKYQNNNEYINDIKHPEAAVAYSEDNISYKIQISKLKLVNNKIHVGNWWGGKGKIYQDLVVLKK